MTLIVPSDNSVRVEMAQIIAYELTKIGISTYLIIIGLDELTHRMLESPTHADHVGGGFDIGFIRWRDHRWSDIIRPELFKLFHSTQINPNNLGPNYYPVNNDTLDTILEFTSNTTDFNQRKEYIQQALEMIVWDIHPVTGIYQSERAFYYRNNTFGLDPNRFPRSSEELYFGDGVSYGHGQVNEIIVASPTHPRNYNPVLSNYYSDMIVHSPAFSGLVETNVDLNYKPGLLSILPYPVAVENNYTGIISSTDPNTATVWEIELRDNIYWHEGYGYRIDNATHRDILKFDADDVVWYYSINLLNPPNGPLSSFRSLFQWVFGTEPEKAIVKVDNHRVQFHLKRPYADLFTFFGTVLPQHILDPTFDAGLGYGSGIRADGTSVPSYDNWVTDDYNIGYRTSGDTTHAATVGNGAYIIYPGENTGQHTVTLTSWNHYFKDNDTSYWKPLVENRPEKYIYTWIDRDIAEINLDDGDIDIMDAHYEAARLYSSMKNKPGIAFTKQLDWDCQTMGYNILNGANGNLANKWVRLAISHMIPRQDIIDSPYLLSGLGQPSFAPFPIQSIYWPHTLEPIEYNFTKAVEYMELAGYNMAPYLTTTSSTTSTPTSTSSTSPTITSSSTSSSQPFTSTPGFGLLISFLGMGIMAIIIVIFRQKRKV